MDDQIQRAYAAYDSDPRVHGPEDFDAFSEALRKEMGHSLLTLDQSALLESLVATHLAEVSSRFACGMEDDYEGVRQARTLLMRIAGATNG